MPRTRPPALGAVPSWCDGWDGLDPLVFGPSPVLTRCAACGVQIRIGSHRYPAVNDAWFHLYPAVDGHDPVPQP